MESEQQIIKQLFQSIEAEDEEKLVELLANGAPLDIFDPKEDIKEIYGVTPFLYAVDRGWEAGCRLLFEYGADPFAKDANGSNAMHYIARSSYLNLEQRNIALFLLERGIEFDAPTMATGTSMRLGHTPLMMACDSGNSWAVDLLLQQGAELERRDTEQTTALYHAVNSFHLNILIKLVQYSANVDILDDDRLFTPLSNAIARKSYEAVIILLDAGADPDICNGINRNALHELCWQSLCHDLIFSNYQILLPSYDSIIATPLVQRRIAAALFAHGVQIDIVGHKGNTPLMLAQQNDMFDMAQLLIEKGADISFCNAKQRELVDIITLSADQQADRPHLSHMLSAISAGDLNRVDTLIQNGFNIHSKTVNGHNALHYAVGYVSDNNERIVDALLNAGIEYDMPSKTNWDCLQRGSTPLMAAAANNNLYAINSLIQAGADINRRNSDGCTALFYAAMTAKIEALKLLLQNGAEPSVSWEWINRMKTISQDYRRALCSPLHIMVILGSVEGVTSLLQCGADPNQQDQWRQSAMHAACDRANIDASLLPVLTALSEDEKSETFELRFQMVKLLVSYGADLNIRNSFGKTPLGVALENDFYSLIKLLVQLGADPLLCTVHQQSVIKQLFL